MPIYRHHHHHHHHHHRQVQMILQGALRPCDAFISVRQIAADFQLNDYGSALLSGVGHEVKMRRFGDVCIGKAPMIDSYRVNDNAFDETASDGERIWYRTAIYQSLARIKGRHDA